MTIKIVLLGKLTEKSQRNNTDDTDTASILSFKIRLHAAIRHVETLRFQKAFLYVYIIALYLCRDMSNYFKKKGRSSGRKAFKG